MIGSVSGPYDWYLVKRGFCCGSTYNVEGLPEFFVCVDVLGVQVTANGSGKEQRVLSQMRNTEHGFVVWIDSWADSSCRIENITNASERCP